MEHWGCDVGTNTCKLSIAKGYTTWFTFPSHWYQHSRYYTEDHLTGSAGVV